MLETKSFKSELAFWLDVLLLVVGFGAAVSILEYHSLVNFPWPFDLIGHFLLPYLIISVLLIPWAVVRKKKALVVVTLFFQVLMARILWGYYGGGSVPDMEGSRFSVAVANVHVSNPQLEEAANVIQKLDPDVVILLEVTKKNIDRWKQGFLPWTHSLLDPQEHPFGMAIFSKLPFEESLVAPNVRAFLRSILVRTDQGPIQILAMHPLPPISPDFSLQRDKVIAAIPDLMFKGMPVLIMGDLNTTPWMSEFRLMVEQGGLSECRKGRGILPSWHANFPLIPIDHCLTNAALATRNFLVFGVPGTDHLGLVADLYRVRQ